MTDLTDSKENTGVEQVAETDRVTAKSAGEPLAVALPIGLLAVVVLLGPAVVCAATIGVAMLLESPKSMPGAVFGAGGAAAAAAIGIGLVRPWKRRLVGDWAVQIMIAQGLTMLFVLVAVLSLYSAARPEPIAFAMAAVGSFIVSQVGVGLVYGRACSVGASEAG